MTRNEFDANQAIATQADKRPQITFRSSQFDDSKPIDRQRAAEILKSARAVGNTPYWYSSAGRYGSNAIDHGYRIARGPFFDWATLFIRRP